MSMQALDQFFHKVLRDPSLQAQLRAVKDEGEFLDAMTRLGEAKDCRFVEAEINLALNACRRAWIERGR